MWISIDERIFKIRSVVPEMQTNEFYFFIINMDSIGYKCCVENFRKKWQTFYIKILSFLAIYTYTEIITSHEL